MKQERWWQRVSTYFDLRDWWVGIFFAEGRTYICPLPTLVIKYDKKSRLKIH